MLYHDISIEGPTGLISLKRLLILKEVPGSLFIVSKLVSKRWPPTLSFSIFEKWMCSSFFATSSKASFSLRTLFVSRFRILKASLTCWFTSSRASSLGELCSSSDLRDNDIFLVIKRRFTQECRECSETRAILFVC